MKSINEMNTLKKEKKENTHIHTKRKLITMAIGKLESLNSLNPKVFCKVK